MTQKGLDPFNIEEKKMARKLLDGRSIFLLNFFFFNLICALGTTK